MHYVFPVKVLADAIEQHPRVIHNWTNRGHYSSPQEAPRQGKPKLYSAENLLETCLISALNGVNFPVHFVEKFKLLDVFLKMARRKIVPGQGRWVLIDPSGTFLGPIDGCEDLDQVSATLESCINSRLLIEDRREAGSTELLTVLNLDNVISRAYNAAARHFGIDGYCPDRLAALMKMGALENE